MRSTSFLRSAIGASIAGAIASGCGATLSNRLPSTPSQAASHRSEIFGYTGSEQFFTVPSGVTQIAVVAQGAGSPSGREYVGGKGGLLRATISVTPGEKLAVFVGGAGAGSSNGSSGSGGFNGGGDGGKGAGTGSYANGGDGGGGASDVRQGGDALSNRVVIAAGGGGAGGGRYYGYGGAGGNVGGSGVAGEYFYYPDGGGGKGGTQNAGGRGGVGGETLGYPRAEHGHRGKLGTRIAGGGSCFFETGATNVKNVRGGAGNGNGQVVISW